MTKATVSSLWKYPFKGARGYQTRYLSVDPALGALGDRRYAVRRNPSTPPGVEWSKKVNFFVAANTPQMAAESPLYLGGEFHAEYGDEVDAPWLQKLGTRLGVGLSMKDCVLDTKGAFNLTDTKEWPTVSILNLATVRHLEKHIGVRSLDTQRFRMNVVVDGLAPFQELEWITKYPGDKVIQIGPIRFQVMDACERCLAINANPLTGTRDIDVLSYLTQMMKDRGYTSPQRGVPAVMGVVARPLGVGVISQGSVLLVQ